MKKILFLLLLLLPFMVHAEVKITSVDLIDNTEGLEVEEHPDFKDLTINLNLQFAKVEDFAKYKAIVFNDTNKEYEIKNGEEFSEGEYIKYEFSTDENKTIKPNEEKTVYVTVSYNKEIPSNKFENAIYREEKNMTINLLNEEISATNIEEVNPNPKTNTGLFIIIVLIISAIILLVLLYNHHKIYHFTLPLLLLLLIPITIYAIETLTIKINANVEIKRAEYKLCYRGIGQGEYNNRYLDYYEGMTWEEFINNDELNHGLFGKNLDDFIRNTHSIGTCGGDGSLAFNEEPVKLEDKIQDKENGCYIYDYRPC